MILVRLSAKMAGIVIQVAAQPLLPPGITGFRHDTIFSRCTATMPTPAAFPDFCHALQAQMPL